MRYARRKDVSNTLTPSGVVIAHVSLTAQIDDAHLHPRDGRLVDAERRSSRAVAPRVTRLPSGVAAGGPIQPVSKRINGVAKDVANFQWTSDRWSTVAWVPRRSNDDWRPARTSGIAGCSRSTQSFKTLKGSRGMNTRWSRGRRVARESGREECAVPVLNGRGG